MLSAGEHGEQCVRMRVEWSSRAIDAKSEVSTRFYGAREVW